jgi:hypothetical protein
MFDDPLISATSGAFFKLLEALAQFSIEVGLGVGDVQALTEKAFVSAAQTLLSEEGAPQPDSVARIAVRTGLYRDTVSNLLAMAGSQGVRPKPFQNPAVRVMRAWRTSQDYTEAGGTPKILPIRGASPSFHALTNATLGESLRPSLILRDLQRVGAVKTVQKRQVQLIRTTYGNPAWDLNQVGQMGDELRDHIRALLQLLQQHQPVPLRRYIVHSGLHAESAAILEREISRGANVLFNGHQRALDHESEATKNTVGQKHRLSATVIILREPVVSAQTKTRTARQTGSPNRAAATVRKTKKR